MSREGNRSGSVRCCNSWQQKQFSLFGEEIDFPDDRQLMPNFAPAISVTCTITTVVGEQDFGTVGYAVEFR